MKWQILANEGDDPVPATATFGFGAGDGFGFNYLGWVAEYGPSDVGESFWAPVDVVEGANIALTDSRDALYTLLNGPANHATFSNSDFTNQEPSSEPPCPGRSNRCVGSAVYVDDLESLPRYGCGATDRLPVVDAHTIGRLDFRRVAEYPVLGNYYSRTWERNVAADGRIPHPPQFPATSTELNRLPK
jgi:hypothetical protein